MPAAPGAAAPTDVLIIGGGLIGLCSAFSLARRGHTVTVIDRERIGAGAARGNAGEVTPLTALPLAGPGMLRETVRGVLSRSHYLSIAPLALPGLTAFGLSFLAHCAPGRVAAGARALDQLTRGAFAAFDSYQRDGISLAGGGTGYLYTHTDPDQLRAYRSGMVARADLLGMQHPDPVLTGAELRVAEPALSHDAPAAFVAPTERFIDPGTFVDDLSTALTALGVQVREGVEALRLDPAASRPTAMSRCSPACWVFKPSCSMSAYARLQRAAPKRESGSHRSATSSRLVCEKDSAGRSQKRGKATRSSCSRSAQRGAFLGSLPARRTAHSACMIVRRSASLPHCWESCLSDARPHRTIAACWSRSSSQTSSTTPTQSSRYSDILRGRAFRSATSKCSARDSLLTRQISTYSSQVRSNCAPKY